MQRQSKPVVWLAGEVKTPPFSAEARLEAGVLLRQLQQGERLGMPHSRPMPAIGPDCHELRIRDADATWRIFYCLAFDAIVVLDVEMKTTQRTPPRTLERCRKRVRQYELATKES